MLSLEVYPSTIEWMSREKGPCLKEPSSSNHQFSGDVLVFSGIYVQGFQRDFRYWNQALMVPRSVQPTKAAFEVTSHKSWQQSWSMSRKVDFFASPKQVAIPDKQKPFKDRYEPSNLFTHWRNHLSWCSFSRCLECFWYVLPVLT